MKYEHKVYAPGVVITTLDGLRKMHPSQAHLITDDMTQEELDELELDSSETPYGMAMNSAASMLRRSMRQTKAGTE